MQANETSSTAAKDVALILDDSLFARELLKKKLVVEGLKVVAFESHGPAFEYLGGNLPDVIFLDHHMPDATGIEILERLKGDTRTAAIPVIMYTSETGEMYLRKVRALGAVDILAKESLEQTDLSARLKSVGVNVQSHEDTPVTDMTQVLPEITEMVEELEVFKEQIPSETINDLSKTFDGSRLKVIQPTTFSEQQLDSLRELLRGERSKFNTMVREQLYDFRQQLLASAEVSTDAESTVTPSAAAPKTPWYQSAVLWLSLLSLMLVFALIWNSGRQNQDWITASTGNDADGGLSGVIDFQPQRDTSAGGVVASAGGVQSDKLLSALVESTNNQMRYGYGERALDDDRLDSLQQMIGWLRDAKFKGTVLLRIHAAEFCVARDVNGTMRMPPNDTPLSGCEFVNLNSGNNLADMQTIRFARFMDTSPHTNGKDQIQVVIDQAVVDYSASSNGFATAGDWNDWSSNVQRIEVVLQPSN